MRPRLLPHTFRSRTLGVTVLLALAVMVTALPAGALTRTSITRVSVADNEGQPQGASHGVSVSGDGRYVAFASLAVTLTGGDTNAQRDVFVRDTQVGSTERVSIRSDGTQGYASAGQFGTDITPDGRYVLFSTQATLASSPDNDTNNRIDVYLRDRVGGATRRVSFKDDGAQFNDGQAAGAVMSDDARYVAFEGSANGIVTGDDNNLNDVFVYDGSAIGTPTTRVSVGPGGVQAIGGHSGRPVISGDGRFVAFESAANNLVVGDTNNYYDVFVRDTQSGETERVSVRTGGAQATGGESRYPSISADGRFVTFASESPNMVSPDGNGVGDVFIRDRVTGVTTRVSVDAAGLDADGTSQHTSSVSDNGRFVAFTSDAHDLTGDATNGKSDVFVRDMWNGETVCVSRNNFGFLVGFDSAGPDISSSGRFCAFASWAPLHNGVDTNGVQDAYLAEMQPQYDQVAGASRYATAVEASKRAFPPGQTDYVVITTGANWPDALGGAALAGAVRGPLLLADPSLMNQPVPLTASIVTEIARLGATKAYIVGGTGAVAGSVETYLGTTLGLSVTRLAGGSRYDTARDVADEVISLQGGDYDGKAFVATGRNFPDALGASPIAFAKGRPILLVPATGNPYLPAQTDQVVILGGSKAVSDAVEIWLNGQLTPSKVDRIAGGSRYDTAAQVADFGVAEGLFWNGVGIATGQKFPDALAGGVMLGQQNAVMLLTPSTSLDTAPQTRLTTNKYWIGGVQYVGGLGAVNQDVRNAVQVAVD